jgi:hypothetical protein
MTEPPTRRRLLLSFAVLIWTGLLITEHFGASEAAGPLNPILVLTYGPYYVLAAAMVERTRDSRWRTLFVIGALLGLTTESYITRVLWVGWHGQENPTIIGGWAPIETVVLVPFWHPMMSMVLPLALTRGVFGIPTAVAAMPRTWAVRFALLIPAVAGMFTDPGPFSPVLGLIECLGLAFLWWLLRRAGGPVPLRPSLGAIASSATIAIAVHLWFLVYGLPFSEPPGFPEPHQLVPAVIGTVVLFVLTVQVIRRPQPAPFAPEPVFPSTRMLLAYAVYAFGVEGGLTLLRIILGPVGDVLRIVAYLTWLPLLAFLLYRARRAAASRQASASA